MYCSPLPACSVFSPLLPGEPPESTPLIQLFEAPWGLERRRATFAATPPQAGPENPSWHSPSFTASWACSCWHHRALTVHQGSSQACDIRKTAGKAADQPSLRALRVFIRGQSCLFTAQRAFPAFFSSILPENTNPSYLTPLPKSTFNTLLLVFISS